jgi:protein phosphatase
MAPNTPESTPTTTAPSKANNGSAAAKVSAVAAACPNCGAAINGQTYCGDCGCVFSGEGAVAGAAGNNHTLPGKLKDRYEFEKLITERGHVQRFRGRDISSGKPVPVVILRAPKGNTNGNGIATAEPVAETEAEPLDVEILPSFEEPMAVVSVEPTPGMPSWPSIAWEKSLIEKVAHPGLPKIVEHFVEGEYEYLVEEVPTGQTLWDAWDDPANNNEKRYPFLIQVAEVMQKFHKAGAMLESIRPDYVVITPEGKARLNDLAELLPLPLPANPPLRATLYTAPELVLNADKADPRANLYSFGAMIYSLWMGRELTDMDFERGSPKPFLPRFPDVHPGFGRLLSKTFIREIDLRFPTDESAKTDATGFTELIKTLDTCRRTLDDVRMEMAAWTTIGMIRTGNEDAYAYLHSVESRIDDTNESSLLILADGMGGYDAGEVAAALCIQTLRKLILQHKMFATLTGAPPAEQEPFDLEACKKILYEALKETNKTVFNAPSQGIGRRGMGCTAEIIYVNGRNVVVGHIGDSRCYHLHDGAIIQLTRDQTLVNRLVELGQITAEEAENHPRKNELQQAVGGRASVEPAIYHGEMKAGDWVLVCSDGLTNHIQADELKQMMQYEAASAEIAARRLVNFANIRGATDNSTVVVLRAT